MWKTEEVTWLCLSMSLIYMGTFGHCLINLRTILPRADSPAVGKESCNLEGFLDLMRVCLVNSFKIWRSGRTDDHGEKSLSKKDKVSRELSITIGSNTHKKKRMELNLTVCSCFWVAVLRLLMCDGALFFGFLCVLVLCFLFGIVWVVAFCSWSLFPAPLCYLIKYNKIKYIWHLWNSILPY